MGFLGRDVGAIEPPSEKASLPIAAAPFDPAVMDPAMTERKYQDSGIDANDIPKLDLFVLIKTYFISKLVSFIFNSSSLILVYQKTLLGSTTR